ncbi:MAG: 30S ribosome-binding factor RbfA [Candidatus Cloacimonetes bacterium]|nr:30S ribosome-binding factor RbfA [Candidatus Cloacimonadota bacterium]
MPRIRIQRLEKVLLRLISNVINLKLRDKYLELVSITRIKVSNDMSHARIYYTHLDTYPNEDVQKALEKSSGFIKNEIAAAKIMRVIPEIKFIYDEFEEKARHLDDIFRQLESEKEQQNKDS